jgi:hypothetical protein
MNFVTLPLHFKFWSLNKKSFETQAFHFGVENFGILLRWHILSFGL